MQPYQENKEDESSLDRVADVYETLVEALGHSESGVRESAAKEFAKRKDKRGISVLVKMLNDEDGNVRLQSAVALNALGWRPTTDDQQAHHLVALQDFQAAKNLGELAIDPLLILLKD